MRIFLRFLIVFFALTGGAVLISSVTSIEFGHSNYWDHRGIPFLIAITFFPRLTLLFSSVPFGGFLWWLGFIFAPRILVALLATVTYWNQNPLLVTVSWLIALGGESSEKYVVVRRSSGGQGFHRAKWVKSEVRDT